MALKLLDVVALIQDLPEQGLSRGQVGTIVEELDGGFYEVEFSDEDGVAYAMVAIPAEQLMVLHYHPLKVA